MPSPGGTPNLNSLWARRPFGWVVHFRGTAFETSLGGRIGKLPLRFFGSESDSAYSRQALGGLLLPRLYIAHRAAAIFLGPDAGRLRLDFVLAAWPFPALFAQRAFCARLIPLRAEADRARLGLV